VRQIEIQGNTSRSRILVGESLKRLADYIPGKNVVIITDENVKALYGNSFPAFPVITIGMGEGIKTLQTASDIFQELLDMEAQRSTFIVGIGGGIVCDITGFIASTFLRGTGFGFVSSTLLSQVDASVGGKNGVNFKGYKNMVGTFNLPDFVICDMDLLKTLNERDVLCGFAEIIKHAAIEDAALFDYLEMNYEPALSLDSDVIEKLVYESVVIKAGVVSRDEKEKGERKKLNFGHTFGHAIEKTIGLPHGEAVSLGMVLAASLSVKKGLLSQADADRITRLLAMYKLPTRITWDRSSIVDALKRDKKRKGESIQFVLLEAIGRSVIVDISIDELDQVMDSL
jgi:3-dehydroquinate synthase